MAEPPVESDRSSGWSGQLPDTPLFAVLRRIQFHRLTGTLSVSRDGEGRDFFFENGELRTARSSREDHRIGASLVRWGFLSQRELQEALDLQRERGGRLDKILVEKGLVSRTVLDAEAKRLMEGIVFSTLSWPDGNFRFQHDTTGIDSDVAFSLSSTEVIIEGIRRMPESEQFLEFLGDLSGVPTITEDPMSFSHSVRLPQEAAYLLSRIDGKTDVGSLLKLAPGSRMAGAKILYALIYCGFVQMRRPEKEAQQDAQKTPAAAAGNVSVASAKPSETPVSERARAVAFRLLSESAHRDLVRNTYRRLDWLSHYDLLGVSTSSTVEEIEEAFRKCSRLFDPSLRERLDLADCGRELKVLSERVRAAHGILANPVSREAYDRKIREAQAFIQEGSTGGGQFAAPSPKVRRWTASQNYGKAKELIAQKDFFPAIQMLQEAVNFAPDNAEYRYVLGLAMLKNRWWRDEALENLKEAAKLDPLRADIQASLAEAYLEQSSLDDAIFYARRASQLEKRTYQELERRVEEAMKVWEAERKRSLFERILRKE